MSVQRSEVRSQRSGVGKMVPVFLFSVFLSSVSSAVTIEDCIETALKDNPDAQAAAQRVKSARAAIR